MAVFFGVAVLIGCGSSSEPTVSRHLVVTAGDGQVALAGTQLPNTIVVGLRDGSGNPIAGHERRRDDGRER